MGPRGSRCRSARCIEEASQRAPRRKGGAEGRAFRENARQGQTRRERRQDGSEDGGRETHDAERLTAQIEEKGFKALARASQIRTEALNSCFDAFSSGEPVSTSLENALRAFRSRQRGAVCRGDHDQSKT